MIKVAAEKRKDVTMISLVNQEHLLEREFMIHDKCYSVLCASLQRRRSRL